MFNRTKKKWKVMIQNGLTLEKIVKKIKKKNQNMIMNN